MVAGLLNSTLARTDGTCISGISQKGASDEPNGPSSVAGVRVGTDGVDVEQLESELLDAQHSRVGTIDTLGILAIAALVPLALRGLVDPRLLIAWSGLVALTTLGWFNRVWGNGDSAQAAGVWLSGVVWAMLPIFCWTRLDDSRVAWVVLFVLGYGLATDAILLPQSFKVSAQPLMFAYAIPYVVAFVSHGLVLETLAVLTLSAPLAAGILGFERIKANLLRERARAATLALVDPLTGLASRLGATVELDRRAAAGEETHVVICDLDDFKWINTHLGHHHGDEALRQLARAMADQLDGWFLARLGGDEFLAINNRCLTTEEQDGITSIVLDHNGPLERRMAMSLGSTWRPAGDVDPEALLAEASLALQEAKKKGKAQMVTATADLMRAEIERHSLADRVQLALERNEIVAWAQPIVDMRTGRPAGAELLARWPQADGSTAMPDTFVPVIEAHGLSHLLGRSMVRQAIELLQILRREDEDQLFISVNISASHMADPKLVEFLEAQLTQGDVTPSRLILELTETERLADAKLRAQAFERLQSLGVGVATDDLGSGWSSINQMIESPFTHVKIDRSLVNAMNRQGGSELVASICNLARGTMQQPIAEGIETEEQVDQLLTAGFRLGQGFLFAKPMPLVELFSYLRSGDTRSIVRSDDKLHGRARTDERTLPTTATLGP